MKLKMKYMNFKPLVELRSSECDSWCGSYSSKCWMVLGAEEKNLKSDGSVQFRDDSPSPPVSHINLSMSQRVQCPLCPWMHWKWCCKRCNYVYDALSHRSLMVLRLSWMDPRKKWQETAGMWDMSIVFPENNQKTNKLNTWSKLAWCRWMIHRLSGSELWPQTWQILCETHHQLMPIDVIHLPLSFFRNSDPKQYRQ